MKRIFLFLIGIFLAATVEGASGPCVIPDRSHFRIHVGTAGLFGAFAHNHLIEARRIEGCGTIDLKNPEMSSIKLNFPAAQIRVLDPKESAKDRAEVQRDNGNRSPAGVGISAHNLRINFD
jgi:hypothetical protein